MRGKDSLTHYDDYFSMYIASFLNSFVFLELIPLHLLSFYVPWRSRNPVSIKPVLTFHFGFVFFQVKKFVELYRNATVLQVLVNAVCYYPEYCCYHTKNWSAIFKGFVCFVWSVKQSLVQSGFMLIIGDEASF